MQIPDSGAASAPTIPSPVAAPPAYAAPPAPAFAGLGVRFGAYLIDSILIGAVYLAGVHLLVTRHEDLFGDTLYYTNGWWLDLGWLIVLTAYFSTAWTAFGATLGQRAVGIQVVRASDGGRLDLGRSLLRVLGWIVASIPVGIGFIVAAGNPRKQGWQDRIAGTVVVHNR